MSDRTPPSSSAGSLSHVEGPPPSSRSRKAAGRQLARRLLSDPKQRAKLAKPIARCVPKNEVDTLLGEVLVQALSPRAAPPDQKKAFRRWLRGIVRHVVARYLDDRRQQSEAIGELPLTGTGRIPEEAIGLKLWAEKQVRLGHLPAEELEAMLREAEGEPLEDIAPSLGLTTNALELRLRRRRAQLREAWARDNEED